jgi:hypothetical protein
MPIIFCRFNLGDLRQSVYLVQGEQMEFLGEIETESLPNFIAFHCDTHKTSKLTLSGPTEYVEHIGYEVRRNAHANFGLNDLDIEYINE